MDLTLRKVYDFAMTTPLDDIRFILDTARLNKTAAERSFEGEYGHGLGKILRGTYEHRIMGDSVFSHILSYTSGACDARMAGAMIPVMSNSGSGNQGISATLPVLVYAEENGKSEEELIRALMLSHLTVIYIKQSLGRLSALSGLFVQQDIPVVRYISKASMSTSNNGGCLVRIGFTADFYIKFLFYIVF